MKVWMLLLFSFSYSAYSSEFTHIKLNPEFEEYLTQPKTKSNLLKAGQKSFAMKSSAMQSVLMNVLLGSQTKGFPVDGEESPLYEEIKGHLEASHKELGLKEVLNINRLNEQFNLGSSNFSGFSWQKPFGVVQVYADRQVTPNIFGQNWLVMDTFTFEIEATTFLEKTSEAGITNMSAAQIGAFAGITFKRVYTYWHYADSYQAGLTADFSKLFLPFVRFNSKGIEKMDGEEVMKREDIWTSRAGGLISTPPLYNISFSGGVLAQFDYQNTTTVQNKSSGDYRYKVGVLSKTTASTGLTLEMQLDFFKLIKFSLLRYDLNYEYSSGKEFNLAFTDKDWQNLKDGEEASELRSILRGTGAVKKLEPYVVRLDESESSAVEQKGSILLWGKLQKQKTEQIRAIKDNSVRVFYKNYAQNVKVVQNFLSRIFSAVVYKILKFPVGTSNAAIFSRQLTMEYEATHPQAAAPDINRIDSTEQFSFVLTQYYNAARTDRWIDRRFKNDVIWFVDNFTTLPKNYKADIRNEIIKGPLLVESNLRVEKAGLHYLLETPDSNIFAHLVKVCRSQMSSLWANEESRKELLQKSLRGREGCVKSLALKFMKFKQDYLSNHLKPSLAKFKDFVTGYYKRTQSLQDLQALFGAENTFINGKLQAQTGTGIPFNTVFSSGQFRGLGVIDNFKRGAGNRVPASIVSE